MSNDPVNPHQSPSGESEARPKAFAARLRASIGVDVLSCALLLAAILLTQGPYERRAERLEVTLPFQTKVIALGPVLPSIAGILLLTTIAVRHAFRTERSRDVWKGVLIVLLGTIAGYYVIVLWLPYVGGPVELSLAWLNTA